MTKRKLENDNSAKYSTIDKNNIQPTDETVAQRSDNTIHESFLEREYTQTINKNNYNFLNKASANSIQYTLRAERRKWMMRLPNLEVFNSIFNITENSRFTKLSPGYYDDITTINRMEYLIATKREQSGHQIWKRDKNTTSSLLLLYDLDYQLPEKWNQTETKDDKIDYEDMI